MSSSIQFEIGAAVGCGGAVFVPMSRYEAVEVSVSDLVCRVPIRLSPTGTICMM